MKARQFHAPPYLAARLTLLLRALSCQMKYGSRLLAARQGATLTEPPWLLPAWAKRDYKSDGADAECSRPVTTRSASAWEEVVRPAVRTFLELNKHMLVPEKFVVRHGDKKWPRKTWGYELGKHTRWLRAQKSSGKEVPAFAKDDLEELGFAWVVSQYKWDNFFMPSLRRFYKLYGHTDVPFTFVVPAGDVEWPERLWGQSLGRTVTNIRMKKHLPKQVEESSCELDAMEFCYRTSIYERNWSQRILPSLQVFRRVFGHCDVGQSFMVPSAEPWPENGWGLHLGWSVMSLRSDRTYVEQVSRDKDILEKLGFVGNHSEAEWSERILPALETFRKEHGHCRVERSFVVPPAEPWPEKAWGYNLGWKAYGKRSRGHYADRVAHDKTILDALGFVWSASNTK